MPAPPGHPTAQTSSSAPATLAPRLAVLAAYVAATLVMTWPYVNYGEFRRAGYEGDARLVVWILAWDNRAVIDGLPLFRANAFFPAPEALRYNEHMFGLSLFTLPWALLGASPLVAYGIVWWSSFVLNGLAAYALVRRVVASRVASFLGSLVFAFSFFMMLHGHAHLQLTLAWLLPVSLLLAERWFDRPSLPRLLAWLGAFIVQSLVSWYMAVMVLVATAVMAVVLVATGHDRAPDTTDTSGTSGAPRHGLWRRRAAHLALAALVVALCVWPFARHYVGLQASDAEAAAASATLDSYWIPPANTMTGRWWLSAVDDRPGSIWGEKSLFLGWIALTLTGIGFVGLARRRPPPARAWFFPVLAVAGLLLSLGPSPELPGGATFAPFHWLAAVPGVGGLRAPARFAVLVTIGVAGLTALGAEALARRGGRRGTMLLCALVPLMLAEWFVVDFPGGKPRPFDVPPIYLTPRVQKARALVSLPDYQGTPQWYLNSDYLYYSTAHWRPIVNGFGRSEPPGYADLVASARLFPASARRLRDFGVDYVVVHADRYPDGAAALLAAARGHPDTRLVSRIGSDYLFSIGE